MLATASKIVGSMFIRGLWFTFGAVSAITFQRWREQHANCTDDASIQKPDTIDTDDIESLESDYDIPDADLETSADQFNEMASHYNNFGEGDTPPIDPTWPINE